MLYSVVGLLLPAPLVASPINNQRQLQRAGQLTDGQDVSVEIQPAFAHLLLKLSRT